MNITRLAKIEDLDWDATHWELLPLKRVHFISDELNTVFTTTTNAGNTGPAVREKMRSTMRKHSSYGTLLPGPQAVLDDLLFRTFRLAPYN